MNSHVFTPLPCFFYMSDSMKMEHHNSRTKIKTLMSIHSRQLTKIKKFSTRQMHLPNLHKVLHKTSGLQ